MPLENPMILAVRSLLKGMGYDKDFFDVQLSGFQKMLADIAGAFKKTQIDVGTIEHRLGQIELTISAIDKSLERILTRCDQSGYVPSVSFSDEKGELSHDR